MALFTPFRALGYICNEVPFAVQRRGKETYVTVSVGKAWQVYTTAGLRLVLVGPQLIHSISALACKGDLTFAAVRGSIIESRRLHRSGEYRGHHADILQLLVLGDNILSLGRDGQLLVWRIGEYDEPQAVIQLSFVPTCMAHPDTYLNKILVGSDDGRMQLWNFSTQQLIFEFKPLGAAVRCITPSPALDVVGIGLADGRAVLYNVQYDELVIDFANAAGVGTNSDLFLRGSAAAAATRAAAGACTAISFRSGGGVPLMAAGGGAGVVTVWNLEQRKLHTIIKDAHDAPLVRLHFFAGEPVLMSAGADNSLKQWIFDGADGAARLLRFRSGHTAPPTAVRHYGDGKRLLSAGQDRALRLFSTIQDAQSRELSQRHTARRAKKLRVAETELKLGRIVALDTCDVRERDWSNVVTAHEGDAAAYVWRLQQFALGEHVLKPPPKELLGGAKPAAVTSVCLSRCGNFGFVGSAAGRVDRYNMQSGLHRGAYSRGGPGAAATAHDGAVYGLAADACNRYVATAGLDGAVRVWDFAKRTLKGQVAAGSPIARIAHHPATGLLAAACDDLVIRMFDAEALRLVRRFRGHTDRVTDLQLSQDCRWLVSSSMDNTLRVWDVPGARVLQVLRLGAPVTSLSLAPAQDLLATTHVERDGVYLWANQLIFGSGADVVPSETPVDARLPTVGTGRSGVRADNDGSSGKAAAAAAAQRAMLRHTARAGSGVSGEGEDEEVAGFSDGDLSASDLEAASSDDGSASQSSDSDGEGAAAGRAAAAAAAAELDPPTSSAYSALDRAGAPVPLVPQLVTLSMLPRTQWQNLVHLDTIKARNRPVEPPKKPEAAPFFLPTLTGANAGRTPVFDTSVGLAEAQPAAAADPATAAAAAAAWGAGSDAEAEAGGGAGGGAPAVGVGRGTSRVLRSGGGPPRSRVAQLLHSCSDAADWTSLVAHLRSLAPSQVDQELRSMALLEGGPPEAERQVELLFDFLEAEVASNANFEFVQALLRAALGVHGEAVAARPALRAAAARVEARVGATWRRLDGLMQHVRCMVGLLGNLQQG